MSTVATTNPTAAIDFISHIIPPPSEGSRRKYFTFAAISYAAVAIVGETYLGPVIEHALTVIGLPGLGTFFWAFLALVIACEHWRNNLAHTVEVTEEVVKDLAQRGPLATKTTAFFDLYQEEQRDNGILPEAHTPEQLQAMLGDDPELLQTFLEVRYARLNDDVESYEKLGSDVASQLGLIGTLVGLGRAVAGMTLGMKDITMGSGGMMSSLGAAQLGTAFSTSIIAAYIIVPMIFMSNAMKTRCRGVSRQLGHVVKRSKMVVEKASRAQPTAAPAPQVSVMSSREHDPRPSLTEQAVPTTPESPVQFVDGKGIIL